MKQKTLFFAFTIFIFNSSIAQKTDETKTSGAEMTFKADAIDYGTIDYGTIDYNSNPFRKIEFTNTGTEPLIITNVKSSCGCLVPSYPKEPIVPGETGEIKVRYETRRIGPFVKTLTIISNAGRQILKVKGTVLAPEKTDDSKKQKNR